MKSKNIAIVGATGMVGETFIRVLQERNFPVNSISFFASSRSAGKEILFQNQTYQVEALTEQSFDRGFDIALFSAGGEISKHFAPRAASKGCVVVDNSSFWRMDPHVPLVVPEVNAHTLATHKGIIANPNCSTIQAVVALAPLHKRFGIKRIVYTTFQAVSGAGMQGTLDLKEGLSGFPPKKFPHPIAGNVIPQIDVFLPNGYTKEEDKMIRETKKILESDAIQVTATAVRVPVFNGHSESINVEFINPYTHEEILEIYKNAPGLQVIDDPHNQMYPMPIQATGKDDTFVGRIRRDESVNNGLHLWVVADNIRKGAATNAIQIAEKL